MRSSRSTMKLTHQRMASRLDQTPESLLYWLEEQLEERGIDAVVYTRYILSLLQDEVDDEQTVVDMANTGIGSVTTSDSGFRCEHFQKDNIKPVTTTKWKHKRYLKQTFPNHHNNNCLDMGSGANHCWLHSDYCSHRWLNSDEDRKLAVVQCLKSASEQEFGIESFVDELCAKLKNIKLLSESNEISIDGKSDVINNNINGSKISAQEQALKYYAAFPALDLNGREVKDVSKADTTGVVVRRMADIKDMDRKKWNGQKIISYMSGTNGTNNGLTDISSKQSRTTANSDNKDIECLDRKKTYFYCRDIETNVSNGDNVFNGDNVLNSDNVLNGDNVLNSDNVLNGDNEDIDSSLVVDESDKFEKLVEKFNSNIALIWSKTGDQSVLAKNDNIWSFDSSFSSNQSSATPSPKSNAIDFWSSKTLTEISERLNSMKAPVGDGMYSIPEFGWESSLLQSLNNFPDDGFIDSTEGTHELNEENNWSSHGLELNQISLQNHQKNSPFIDFNAIVSTTPPKCSEKELPKLVTMAYPVHKPKCLSPPLDENLLTSPKTHFQPIKTDSFYRDESDEGEGSLLDITDGEVNKLVICSDKCPNNGDNKPNVDIFAHKLRPLSTSLEEMASFMGPFNDFELNVNDLLTSLPINEEIELNSGLKSNKMSDKWTSTESLEMSCEVKPKLEPILESSVENEPEYQDLCDMINEVLRNGISEEYSAINSSNCSTSSTPTPSALDDWYDSDFAYNCNDLIGSRSREKRLSWNCYWDTYDIGVNGVNGSEQAVGTDTNALNKNICDQPMVNKYALETPPIERLANNEAFDEVFVEQSFFDLNDANEECPEFEELLDDYCLPEEDSVYDFDNFNGVYKENNDYSTGGSVANDYQTSQEVVVSDDSSSSFGHQFRLQLKPRHNEVGKRGRKPCTFFIEGICSRIDCKYSHQISAITCKYWEEGFCFKADLCPFLHGYADDNNIVDKLKKTSTKSYTIESESDFPSLATYPDSGHTTPIPSELEPKPVVEQHFFEFRTKSVADNRTMTSTTGVSKAKLPIAVFMKKKVRKRKDRNLQ